MLCLYLLYYCVFSIAELIYWNNYHKLSIWFSIFEYIIRSIYENSKFISFSKIIENVTYNLTSSAFTSSLGMISSSFLWRLFIFNYFSKSISGLIFAAFSIGSFPGTLFNSIIGPIVVRDKIKLPEKYWNFF